MWVTYPCREKFYEAKLQQQQQELKQLQEERRKLMEIQEKIEVLQKACPDLQVGRLSFFLRLLKSETLFSHHFSQVKKTCFKKLVTNCVLH